MSEGLGNKPTGLEPPRYQRTLCRAREAAMPDPSRARSPGRLGGTRAVGTGGAAPALPGRRTAREGCGLRAAGLRQNQPPPLPPAPGEEQKLRRAACVWRGCPGHALAWPAVSGNARASQESFGAAAASCPQAGSQPPDSQKPLAEPPPPPRRHCQHQGPSG